MWFLKGQGIDSYDELCEKSCAASGEYNALSKRIREIESRQKEIGELQKQIGNYGKTREVYAKYKASGFDSGFYDIHAAEIILHRAAKKHFEGLGLKKLPSINTLKQEWAALEAERRKLYTGYKASKQNNVALGVAKSNADAMLFGTRTPLEKAHGYDAR